ncbi:iron-containing alcohol dehydrogenase family protein [Exiguobacterium sp. KRL4]|nr:iron-containing alcohol dehydrogenase family protein [Exiguobacterium sp. KRL4]
MIRQAVLQYIHEEHAMDRLTTLLAGRKAVMIHREKTLQAASP